MKTPLAAAALLLAAFAAAPAHATQGLNCRPVTGTGPELALVLAAGGGIGPASIMERPGSGKWERIDVRQSWIDEHRVWVDLTDEGRMRDEGRLRGTFVRTARHWYVIGTFVRGGRLYRVRCEEG
jgi:hypothetical protein